MAKEQRESNTSHAYFPPVISVLGHVDHGKTSLLDRIRETSHASREVGGITQKIGASYIEISHEGEKRKLTFIDTPGHEAFANMRSQGVNAADVVLLTIAADDGIMPQTKESIDKIKEAKLPYIVVFTKVDLESANVERVKQQLLAEQVLLEGYGGEIPYISVSSKTGLNIKELLDLIVLVYDLSSGGKDDNAELMSVVIDSKIDKKRGITATVVIKQGGLAVSDKLYIEGKEVGKVRALFDANGVNVKLVKPGDAVEILGITEVLPTGSLLYNKPVNRVQPAESSARRTPIDLSELFAEKQSDHVEVILKTETSGEMEAIKETLPDEVDIAFEGQGDIAVADVLMAKDLRALIIGFNVKVAKDAQRLADTEHVLYRTYSIIYELLEEIEDAIEALREQGREKILGRASILARFVGSEGDILGLRVIEGRLHVNDSIRILRGDKIVGESQLKTLRRVKDDIKEAGKGMECGATLSPSIDFTPGDVLLSYS